MSNLNILIVDDEKLIQTLVTNVLAGLGFNNVTQANSGRKAIELVAETRYDFIITDWRMPDMEGIDMVRYVRTTSGCPNQRTPIIMLTGNTEAHYVKTAIQSGVNAYLLKPFTAEQLIRRIRTVIEQPRDFIVARNYQGPDRRHSTLPPPGGTDRRKPRKK